MSREAFITAKNPEVLLWRDDKDVSYQHPYLSDETTPLEANYLLPHMVTGPENLANATQPPLFSWMFTSR
ncbi:hypothetical protein ACIGCM_09510 [Pseudomonas sp. NPDC078700]|uniref:hypothetical protein n=1 Tax=Pseudomonas sp. NPDC078700 TaxID=3364424 RepID=UPI0037C5FE63